MRTWVVICAVLMTMSAAIAQQAKPRVLLGYEKTRFKTALIKQMEQTLNAQGCDVVVVRHSKKKGLGNHKASDFDAVFITNSGAHSKVRPWITNWLNQNKAYGGRVLLHTTQTSNWEVKTTVDAVTSASSKRDANSLAAEYVATLNTILESKPTE